MAEAKAEPSRIAWHRWLAKLPELLKEHPERVTDPRGAELSCAYREDALRDYAAYVTVGIFEADVAIEVVAGAVATLQEMRVYL